METATMPILPRLIALYEREGLSISSGLDACLSGNRHSEFTFLFDDKDSLTGNLGIALKEVYFLECLLGGAYRPGTIYGVGNSFGWSSFIFALACPTARVGVIEAGEDDFTGPWVDKTNAIAQREGLDLTVVRGRSPEGTPALVEGVLGGKVDLAFIDGEHSPDQVKADIRAVLPYMGTDGAILLHDVVAFDLLDAVREVIAETGLQGRMLHCTPSGMAVVHGPDWPEEAKAVCRHFGANHWAQVMLDHFRGEPINYKLGSETA
jgi:predicted O-methyltransferase YrrM